MRLKSLSKSTACPSYVIFAVPSTLTVGKIAKNVLKRNFSVDTPNKKWVTDVTEFKIKGRKIYLSPILDLFNGEIISYSISTSPTYKLIEVRKYKSMSSAL
ncbi:hypothetical protein EfmJHP10_27250 [Enterococcus faecium]|nr:hypothetical protein EfmJHP10_27250 [Enterococcus faecium]